MAAALQILFMRRHFRRERVFRDRTNPLELYNDEDMIKRYRFPRATVLELIDRVSPMIETPTRRSMSISTSTQSMLCNQLLHKQYIQFPRDADLTAVKEGFYRIATFPKVIGAIDGTLIPIQGLSGDDEPNFVCRKGYHAINVQAVVDHKLRFTNVVVRWPGSTHDAFILQQSALYRHMDTNLNAGWLLGDSGYPLKVWLITPLANPSNPQEQRFNNSHCKTRNIVERAFGVLKQRFRCLHKTGGALSYRPERSTNIIETCFRLHNLAVEKNIPLNLDQPLPILHNDHINQQQNIAAQALRNQIIQRF
ncbi:HARBI1 [Mytilus coruscus]|uniref:HARBI1 n=1 Tax=Mytilus coruscus TaxID=42192 RepID=A0A6J7ZXM1_MYTCO|nr:HARBI1 [Mytilus coruscus]